MPEAAEVKHNVDLLRLFAVGKKIIDVQINSGRYVRSPIKAFEHLVGMPIARIDSKGKLVLWQFSDIEGFGVDLFALNTFGMTGCWTVDDAETRHTRLTIYLEGTTLRFHDQRNFGTFRVVSQKTALAKWHSLGPNVLSNPDFLAAPDMPEVLPSLVQRFGKKLTVAEALLDQRIFCGVGNYLRADAMYLAGIDPRRPIVDLDRDDLELLWAKANWVAKCAYHDRDVFGQHWTSPRGNWSFTNVCYRQAASPNGNPIESYVDRNGRTVWWCPEEQE